MKEIKQALEGDTINQYLLIKSVTRSVATNGKPYLTINLQDQSGEIEAKFWDVSREDEELYQPDRIVLVEGDITSFRGRSQLRIRQMRLAKETDPITKADLVPVAPVPVGEMMDKLTQYMFNMQNSVLQRITRALVKKHQSAFFDYPAATKNHHEYMSGLAYHVTSMLDLAEAICRLYPELDSDLLYAGIILHDMGKVIELSGPTATTYTLEGTLLGHITIMVNEVAEAAKSLGLEEEEEVVILKHLILSHHSKGEWGSPKPPLIREAEILHMIDNLDAKMNMMSRALEHVKPGEFTERVFALDNRSFYKPIFQSKSLLV